MVCTAFFFQFFIFSLSNNLIDCLTGTTFYILYMIPHIICVGSRLVFTFGCICAVVVYGVYKYIYHLRCR